MVVPERGAAGRSEAFRLQLAGLLRIGRDAVFWRLAPLMATTAGTHIAIQTLWAGPWLRDVAGLDRIGVANRLMAMAIGFLIGIISIGAVADRLGRRGVDLLSVMLAFLVLFFLAELAILLQWTRLSLPIWTLFGMTGQAAILGYPWLASHYGAALSGRANTAINLVTFLAAFGAQYGIGALIDLFPTTAEAYSARGYQVGFGAFFALQLLALAWYLPGHRALLAASRTA